MKTKKLALIAGCIAVLFLACKKETLIDNNIPETISSDINVENGYLSFDNKQDLNAYIMKISEALNNDNKNQKSGSIIKSPKGFYSLANRIANADNFQKSGEMNEEKEKEAFLAELNRTLIPEKVIHYVVDTANRVKVNGKIHQITELGTFIYYNYDSTNFHQLYDNFIETHKNYDFKKDSITYNYKDIEFIDTYGLVTKGDFNAEDIIKMINGETDKEIEDTHKNGSLHINQNNTRKYDLSTFPHGGDNVIGQAVTNIGLNNMRSKKFDDNHRVNVGLYNLNYGFFKSVSFKVQYQYKHWVTIKVGFWKWAHEIYLFYYWRTITAPEIAVGVEYFKGYTTFETFGLDPIPYQTGKDVYLKNYTNATANMVYKGIFSEPFDKISGWINNIDVYSGTVKINRYSYNYDVNSIFHEGLNYIEQEFKNKTSTYIYNGLNNSKTSMLIIPDAGIHTNREYLLLKGISHYPYCSERKIRFGNPSFGISFKSNNGNWAISPYTPNGFQIEDACIFGAVRANGIWKGVRIYTK